MASIGVFLTQHPDKPTTEHVGEIKGHDLDVRQDACFRALVALRNQGFPEVGNDGTFTGALDERETYAKAALIFARRDAHRAIHGRSTKGSRLDQVIRLNTGETVDSDVFAAEGERSNQSEQLWDDRSLMELDAIDDDCSERLRELSNKGAAEARAVKLMILLQQMKLLGEPIPNAAQSALRRLRDETGLALNVTLL